MCLLSCVLLSANLMFLPVWPRFSLACCQAAADVEVAQAQANAALRREREELLRVKNTLALERSEFRRYRGSSEATMKRLRQEATRAEQLQEQLTSKGLRLKQKEAEARALASDGSMVRGLRESLMSKVSYEWERRWDGMHKRWIE